MLNKIKHYRLERNMTLANLAELMGWSAARLSNYENGFRKPSLNDCRLIVRTLNKVGCKVGLDDVFPPPQEGKSAA